MPLSILHQWNRRKTGPDLTDRARPGSKHHIVTDANGAPLAAISTGVNVKIVAQLPPPIEAIPPIRDLCGRPLQRPHAIYADCGYNSERHRRALHNRGIESMLAQRRTKHGSGLDEYRWVVEHTHAWLHHFRRLRIHFEHRADIHGALLKLGCCLIYWNTLRRASNLYETVPYYDISFSLVDFCRFVFLCDLIISINNSIDGNAFKLYEIQCDIQRWHE